MTPTFIVFYGVWLILCGTVLYWPFEAIADWQDRRDPNRELRRLIRRFRKITRWIRLDPTSRFVYRAGLVAMGAAMLLFGIVG